MINLILLRKEIGGLKLIVWLIVAMCALDLLYIAGTGFPDIETESDRANAASEGLVSTIVNLLLLGMLMGVYLFGQEREHKTIPFLDALPVGRTTLFLHKYLAAGCVIVLMTVTFQSYSVLLNWASRDSLSPAWDWWAVGRESIGMCLLSYAIVGVSAFGSLSRKWFPLLAGLAVWTVVVIRMSDSWMSTWLDSAQLLRWGIDAKDSSVPWRPVLGHIGMGTIGWLGAFVGFQYRDGFISRQVERMAQWRLASWAIALGQLAAAAVWVTAVFSLSGESESRVVESVAAGDVVIDGSSETASFVGFGRERTQYYEVIFRQSHRHDVERVIGWLDEVHEQVRRFFDNPPRPSARIVLDTASPVMSHAAAQTNWTKIRAPLARAKDDLDLLRTIRHETAHVYIEQLSGGRATDQFNALRMFHEGVASLAELADLTDQMNLESEPRLQKERWVAGVDSRGRVPLTLLCDDQRLTAVRDPNIVYPLGFVVAEAMIDAGGPTLPRRFLEALAVTSLPPGASAQEIWRILLQKCNSSFDRVIAHYEARLDALAEREQEFIASLPKCQVDVRVEAGEIVITIIPKDVQETTFVPLCAYERNIALGTLPENLHPTSPFQFRMARSSISGSKLRLLVGWASPKCEGAIYEPWQEIELLPSTGNGN